MLFKCFLLQAALFTLASSSPIGLLLLFPELHKQYFYYVKTKVSVSTLTPAESSSYWTIEGKLVVTPYDNYTKARFGLENLKTSMFGKNSGYSSYQSDEDVDYLQQPWEVEYAMDGFISSIYVGEEPVWASNIKRAISINFQLKVLDGTYTNEEPCLYESCVVMYINKGNVVHKYNSVRMSSLATERSWSSVPIVWTTDYDTRISADTVTTAEKVYELDGRTGLMSLNSKGDFQYKTHSHILGVSSELSLDYDTTVPLKQSIEKLSLTKASVQYEAHDISDPTNNIISKTQNELRNKTYEILLKIASHGIDADNIVRDASQIHSLDFVDLLNTMTQLDYESIHSLFEEMVLGTSYDVETSRNLFLEVVPHVRTNACALFIKHLVMEEKEKVEDATLLSLIRKLPFNIANYSQELLEQLEVLTKLDLEFTQEIRHAGILSFATLVFKTHEAWKVKQDYFDTIVVQYFRMYSECPQYVDRLVWLQGLCNMGYSAQSYTQTIYSDKKRERHERLWAAIDGSPNINRPYTVTEKTLPIIMDEKEHIQLRIAALHTFLKSDIRATDFSYVHNFIKNGNNNQLKSFWFSTIKSLENNKLYMGYRTASYYVPFIVNRLDAPDSTYWATTNFIASSEGETGSGTLQAMSVGEPLTDLPALMLFKLSTAGRRPMEIAVYLLVEGLTTNIYNTVWLHNAHVFMEKYRPMMTNMKALAEVLKNMKVKILDPEKVHIDILVKIHEQTVFVSHINYTKFFTFNGDDELMKSIGDIIKFGSHINQQIVHYPLQMDVAMPTDLGTPIRLQSTVVSFTSLRGNITAPISQEYRTWKNGLLIRHSSIAVTSVAVAAPSLRSMHTARVQQAAVIRLPVHCDVTLPPHSDGNGISIKWPHIGSQYGGVAMHSRAQIEVDSPRGRDQYTVTSGLNTDPTDDNGVFFDCERPMSGAEVMEKLFAPKASYDFINSVQPALIVLNSIFLLTAPTPGSCGLIIPPQKMTSSENEELEIKLTVESFNFSINDRMEMKIAHSIIFREDSPNGSRPEQYTISGYTQLSSRTGHFSYQTLAVAEHPKSAVRWKVCLQEDESAHVSMDQDITSLPSSYDGKLTLSYSSGDSDLSCPAESQLTLKYRGGPSNDREQSERFFEVQVEGKKLPHWDVDSSIIGHTAFGQLLKTIDSKNLNITAVVKEKNGVASLSINNGSDMTFKSERFGWLMDSWSQMQILKKFGIYRECRLQESTIQTLFGTTERLSPVQCKESLVLADCSAFPKFGIFRLKDGGIKAYLGGSFVTITNGGGGVELTTTGESDDLIVTYFDDGVKIDSRLSDVQIYYRSKETAIIVSHAYMSISCGECAQKPYNLC